MSLRPRSSQLNEFLTELDPLRRGRSRFLFAALVVLLALALTAGSEWILGSTAASVFAIIVAASAGLFGLLAGLCTAGIAVLAIDYFYIYPVFRFNFDATTLRVAVGLTTIATIAHFVERRMVRIVRSRVQLPLGIHGNFDGVENGVAYGWALDADHPAKPLLVTVFLNGHPVRQVAAVHYRSDVAERMKAGSHGFYVDVAEHFRVETDVLIDARFPTGDRLPNTPKSIRVPAIARPPGRPAILFMHIPKTAGTAFREAMAANFLEFEIAYLYPGPPGFLVTDLRDLPLEQLRAFRIVIGHFQFGMHERLPQACEYITIVREPASRILSQYSYLQQFQPELVTGSNGQWIRLEELFEKRLTVDFDNTMVRCFGGVDERVFPPGRLTSESYERAVHHLRTAFRFVGHQESAAESFDWLKRHYNWNAVHSLPRVNVGAVAHSEEVAELNAAIRHYNRWDYLLYQEVLRLFPQPLAGQTRHDHDT
jgi:hypothetical protein